MGVNNEQFGTHEKLSWGVQGNLNWMPGYRIQIDMVTVRQLFNVVVWPILFSLIFADV